MLAIQGGSVYDKKRVIIGILEVILILIVCSACEKKDSEISPSDSVEYLEVIKDGETIEGLDVESNENIWGQITDIAGDSITIKVYKKVIDETAPNGWYVKDANEKKSGCLISNRFLYLLNS